jgi:chemotaxis protein MotB
MAQRVRRRNHEEEHENEERWLLTYADMITLLMVLFIVLFSIGQVDLKKFEQLKAGLSSSFGNGGDAAVSGGAGVLDAGDGPLDGQSAQDILDAQAAAEKAQERQLNQTAGEIKETLTGQGLGDKVTFRFEDRGLVLQVVSDDVLFDLGKAALKPQGQTVLDGIAGAIKQVPNNIAVEGHTDNRPIRGFPFPTNWELSNARATTVLRYLVEHRAVPAKRISSAGYADTRPLFANDTDENQARNRRVEIVILAPAVTVADTGGSTGGTPDKEPS